MDGSGSSFQPGAVPHGSGAGTTSNNFKRFRVIPYNPRTPGGNDQIASFKDDVKDYAQDTGSWVTLRTPATSLEEIITLNPKLSEEEQKSLYDTTHGKWQRDSTLLFNYIKPCLVFTDEQYNQTDIDYIRENFTSLETYTISRTSKAEAEKRKAAKSGKCRRC